MHLVIFNGSPRVKKYSNTDHILRAFTRGLEENGSTFELYTLSDKKEWELARSAFEGHDRIMIALPLYVECIPGLLLEFLETLSPKEIPGTEISFLLQGGFAEGCQLRCGEEFLRQLPQQLGCACGGCLVKGNNFGIRLFEGAKLDKATMPYKRMGKLFAQKGSFETAEAKKFTGPEVYSLPIRLGLGLIFHTVGRVIFRNAAKNWGCIRSLDDRPYLL